MKQIDRLVAQLERETPRSRRVLEAVPEGHEEWAPHERSMPMGRLAILVASMPSWIGLIVRQDELDIQPAGGGKFQPPPMGTRDERVAALEKSVADGVAALRGASDELLATTTWKLLVGGRVVSEEPRLVVIEDSLMHWAHHRGQLTVYLRLKGALVPSVYGPSADDARFA